MRGNGFANSIKLDDIELSAVEGHDFVVRQSCLQRTSKLAACARDQNLHPVNPVLIL
jgi:hypothetical protein